jgi:hypothetical protein
MAEQSYWVGQRNQALARGEAQVHSATAAHPLVSNPDFDRERLARASKGEVQPMMRERRTSPQRGRTSKTSHQ